MKNSALFFTLLFLALSCTTHSAKNPAEKISADTANAVLLEQTPLLEVPKTIAFGYNPNQNELPNSAEFTQIDTLGYSIQLNGQFLTEYQNDSIFISEDLDFSLAGRLLKVSNTANQPVTIQFCLNDYIQVQWNHELFTSKGFDHAYWQSIQNFYSGQTQSLPLQDSAQYFFRIPFITAELSEINQKKQQLQLRDTLVVLHKESYTDSAEFLCNGWPCTYWVRNSVLKIQAENTAPIYLVLVYNYTC